MKLFLHLLATIMLRRWTIMASGLCFWTMQGIAIAATITSDTKAIPTLDLKETVSVHRLRLTGRIEAGDADRLRGLLLRLEKARREGDAPLATMELSSIGGDLLEGLKIGYLLREFDVATVVRRGDQCLSACAMAFLGGTEARHPRAPVPSRTIEIGGQVAFHNLSTDIDGLGRGAHGDIEAGIARSFGLAREGAAAVLRYAAHMGLESGFVARMLALAPDQWVYVDTVEAFLEVGACPLELETPLPRLEQQVLNICEHATGWRIPDEASLVKSMRLREAQRHLLEQLKRRIEVIDTSGPLVAQLSGVIGSQDHRLITSIYEDLRAAGVKLPRRQGQSFALDVPGVGGARRECYVNLSITQPDLFEMVAIGPLGAQENVIAPPRSCPRLYRYGNSAVLNPRR